MFYHVYDVGSCEFTAGDGVGRQSAKTGADDDCRRWEVNVANVSVGCCRRDISDWQEAEMAVDFSQKQIQSEISLYKLGSIECV